MYGFLSVQRFLLFFVCPRTPVIHKMYGFLPLGPWPPFSPLISSYLLALTLRKHLLTHLLQSLHQLLPLLHLQIKAETSRLQTLNTSKEDAAFPALPHLHHHLEDTTEGPGSPSGNKGSCMDQSTASPTPFWAPGSWDPGPWDLAPYSQGLGRKFTHEQSW